MAHQVGYDPAWRYRDVLERQAHGATQSLITGEPVAAIPFSPAEIDRMVDRYAAKVGHAGVRLRKAAPAPILPPTGDEKLYNRTLQRRVLRPFMRSVRSGLSQATAAAEALERLDRIPVRTTRRTGLIKAEVDAQAARLQGYHRRRLISTFRRSLAVDIRPVLSEAPIRRLMNGWRRENIDLIQTVPERLKAGLRTKMTRAFREAPFDQARLQRIVAQQGRVGGYDLRRITRDQTSKAIGQLTRARHQQIGIDEYTWQTSRDGRVRDSHAILEGTRQTYDNPPSVGNPGQDIQCRCVAAPVIPDDLVDPQAAPASNDLTAVSRKLPTPPTAAVRAADADSNFVGMLAKNAKAHGMSVSDYRTQANNAMTRLFRNKQVNIQVREETLPKILRSGRFKSQFETQSSEGLFSPSLRRKFERDIIGVADDVAATERPIYGWAGDLKYKELQSTVDAYGKVTVRLKNSVRPRSTATVGDSLNEGLVPSPMNKFDVRSVHATRSGFDPLKAQSLDDIAQSRQYAEVQVHGQVRVSDIDRVLINSDTARQNPELVRSLHKSGIRVDEYDTIWDRYRKFGEQGNPVPRQIKPGELRAEGGLPT